MWPPRSSRLSEGLGEEQSPVVPRGRGVDRRAACCVPTPCNIISVTCYAATRDRKLLALLYFLDRADGGMLRRYPFTFKVASFAAMNARMASDISRSFSHCSLYKVIGKRPIP